MSRSGKVLVAMSGGVDSSVAACLLREQGYECIGVFMRVGAAGHTDAFANSSAAVQTPPAAPNPPNAATRRLKHGCCSVADALDARTVASRLGIPFYVLNFEADFARIVDYFVDEYARGRTPNPCIQCNIQLKFGKLLAYADLLDAEFVATGHYARILRRDGQPCLARAVNHAKDQSYVLFGVERRHLGRFAFPLGEIGDKSDVRRMAASLGLAVHDKPDSQEICFVPDQDYKSLVRARRPHTRRAGEIVDASGRVLAQHDGVANFTIGQRRGLGFAAGQPVYVTRLDVLENRVTVGPQEALRSAGLCAHNVNWLVEPPPAAEWRPAEIKIRHMHTAAAGEICRQIGLVATDATEDAALGSAAVGVPCDMSPERLATPAAAAVERASARFETPQLAVTPGQAAVFYGADDIVLGGGWITAPVPESTSSA
jgi:tRNA-specific 2-thiouridylase